jgi:hypothetical protein
MRRSAHRSDEAKPKKEKFDFEKMKAAATHPDSSVRKQTFVEYFERFGEFPSYLFDNESHIDDRLLATIDDLMKDPEISKDLRAGIETLMRRLPS